MYHKLLAYTEINFQKNMWFSSCLLTVLGVQGVVGKCSWSSFMVSVVNCNTFNLLSPKHSYDALLNSPL